MKPKNTLRSFLASTVSAVTSRFHPNEDKTMKQKRHVNPVAALFGIAVTAAPLVHGQISYLPITGDTDCEIDSVKVYTHAVDFGSGTPRALINGVQFQAGGTTFGSIAGTSATVGTGTTTIPSAHAGDGNADPYLNGASPCDMENLVRDMNYNDATGEITLTGLTPGQPYRFRLYNRVWGAAAANRGQNIGFDTNGVGTSIAEAEHTGTFNQDNATNPDPGFANWWQVNACTYEYTLAAGVTQLKVYINATSSASYHLYGLTNEEAGPDETPPVIATTNPADDSSGVYPGTSLVATFSEDIALTGSGTITITDDDDASGTQTINLPSASVTVSGTNLLINPASNLEFGTNYSVQISSNAIRDLAETPNAFAGISDNTTWNFITAATDGSPPVLAAVNPFDPADGATEVLVESPLSVTFDENILINSSAAQVLLDEDFESDNGGFAPAGTPNDWAYGTPNSDNNAGLLLTTGNGGSAKCWATTLGTGGTPSGTIDTNANSILHSPKTAGNGIDLTGIATAQLEFAAAIDAAGGDTIEVVVRDVADGSALVTLTPFTPAVSADWATYGPYDISDAVGKEVYLEFRYQGTNSAYIGLYIDDVRVTGVGATDMITLKDLTHMTDTVIPVNDISQVSVSGSTLTINPAAPLAPESNYAIQIGSTAIRNYNELNFAGIAGTTTWNFTTTGPKTLTWSPSGGGASDGAGTWLATGKWWNGAANVNWGNSTPDNAVIGNGGAGGDITLGAVNAGTVLIDNFTGTYAFKSGSLAQSGGITIGANAGTVSLESPVSGTGGVTVNAPSRVNFRSGAKTFTGDLVITGGAEVLEYNMDMGTGNLTLNGGVLVDYWGGNMNRTLGSGPGQVQILGGASGFCGQGSNGVTVRLNNSDNEVVWGSTYFNPSKLVLQSPWANTNGKLTWRNRLDLNGTMRTINVNKDHGASVDGFANMINTITNNAGTAAGLIKEGPGRLILSATNDYDGGTQVTNGILVINGSLADATMAISAGSVSGSGTLTFNVAGATIDKIVMTGGTLTATGLTVNVNGSLTQPEYVLVDATGGGAISGTFAGLTGAPGYTLDYGTANQVKLVGPGGGSAYDTWATGGELFDGDANGDGVKDGLAFLLGAVTPSENAIGRLPTVSESGGGLILTFNCLPISARGTATLKVAHSNTLASWTATTDEVPDANDPTPDNNVTFVVDTVSEAPLNKVTATIGSGAAAAGKLFGRLEASQP
jgi:autotransporter-associated beta strand protein